MVPNTGDDVPIPRHSRTPSDGLRGGGTPKKLLEGLTLSFRLAPEGCNMAA
jgi:hypothetical protein